MPRKSTAKSKQNPDWDDAAQSSRFLETAKTVEASDDPEDFERALKRIGSKSKSEPKPSR
jgi:hypothetical protein